MKALAITPDRDNHGNDYTGAFHPESLKFAALYGAQLVRSTIDPQLDDASRKLSMLAALAALKTSGALFGLVAFFCHGLRYSLPQWGWTVADAKILARALAGIMEPSGSVVLYACSTAGGFSPARGAPAGEGGFADALRDALSMYGLDGGAVWAHEHAGHTTCNPLVRRFDILPGALGSEWVVPRDSAAWDAWARTLKREAHKPKEGDLRFRFPLMSQATLVAELDAVKP